MKPFAGLIALLLCPLWHTRTDAAEFLVETNSGEVILGEWAGTTETALRLRSDAGPAAVAFDQIVSVKPASGSDQGIGPQQSVVLVDGSSVNAADLSITDGTLRIEPRRQDPIELPIEQVRAIRFRLGTPATDPQWFGLLEKESRSDRMVIRRGSDQLDPIEGVAVGLNAQELKFELDGDPVDAPLNRLEGVLFGATDSASSRAKVKVSDIFGSTFLASRLEPNAGTEQVEILLPGNVKHQIPLSQIEQITWASGRVLLSGQKPADWSMKTRIPLQLPSDLVGDWFGPIADGDDLVAVAGGAAEYRVEKGFQTLAGSVGRDPEVAVGGQTRVRIYVDEAVAWDQTLKGSEEKGFRIPVTDALRVRLEVSAGEDGELGDQVRFYKPRLLK